MLNDFKLTENFNLREFQCKCGCEQVKIGADLIRDLQRLRDALGVPITITSGYRCPSYNKRIGGAKESQHMNGRAVDIQANVPLQVIIDTARRIGGFRGIGLYKRSKFVHLDNRDIPAYWEE